MLIFLMLEIGLFLLARAKIWINNYWIFMLLGVMCGLLLYLKARRREKIEILAQDTFAEYNSIKEEENHVVSEEKTE